MKRHVILLLVFTFMLMAYKGTKNYMVSAADKDMPEPAGEWKLDGNVYDYAGNNHGVLAGSAVFDDGMKGRAVMLEKSGDYVNIPNADNLSGMEQLTVSVWIKLKELPKENYFPVGKDTGDYSYRFVIFPDGTGHFVVSTTHAPWYATGTVARFTEPLSTDAWYNIVGTYDGKYVRVYCNGELMGTGPQPVSGSITVSGSPLRFGYMESSGIECSKGYIDEVRIYDTALSEKQVKALCQSYADDENNRKIRVNRIKRSSPRPYINSSGVPVSTDFIIRLYVPDDKSDKVDAESLDIWLQPEGEAPYKIIESGSFLSNYYGIIRHKTDSELGKVLNIYTDPYEDLKPDKKYTVKINAKSYKGYVMADGDAEWSFTTAGRYKDGKQYGKVYYISPSGNDNNTGTSKSSPWKTIDRVNRHAATGDGFEPGDRILFQGGSKYKGNLIVNENNSGNHYNHIIIGSYGEGQAIIDAGAGTGLVADSASYITIDNLKFIGSWVYPRPEACNGIDIRGVGSHITVQNVEVSGFGGLGISINYNPPEKTANGCYYNIKIIDSLVHDNGFGGFKAINTGFLEVTRVTANHNSGIFFEPASAYGINLQSCDYAVVQHCKADDNGWGAGQGGCVAIAAEFQCTYVLFQYNEVSRQHHGFFDGDGVCFDGVDFGIMQYNYTHDNDGAGLLMSGEDLVGSSEHCIVRYNISKDDAKYNPFGYYGGGFLWASVNGVCFYNNTIFNSNEGQPAMRCLDTTGSVKVFNNIFITEKSPLVIMSGSGLQFFNNAYWPVDSSFHVKWAGSDYFSLNDFSYGTGQEIYNNVFKGLETDPKLSNIKGSDFRLINTSPLAGAGLDFGELNISWDPYGFAEDKFLSQYFDTVPRDFYGNVLPVSGISIGASEPFDPSELLPETTKEAPHETPSEPLATPPSDTLTDTPAETGNAVPEDTDGGTVTQVEPDEQEKPHTNPPQETPKEKVSNDNSPDTGDNGTMKLPVILLLTILIAAGTALLANKQKNKACFIRKKS